MSARAGLAPPGDRSRRPGKSGRGTVLPEEWDKGLKPLACKTIGSMGTGEVLVRFTGARGEAVAHLPWGSARMRCPKCDAEMTRTEKVIKDEKTGEVKERWTRYQCSNPRCKYRIG